MSVAVPPVCEQVRSAPSAEPLPALFLDRDGVMIEERNYLGDPDGVVLIDGIEAAIIVARGLGWHVVVTTNQSGIGRGYYSLDDYGRVEARVAELLAERGVAVDATYACPFHPGGQAPFAVDHAWRKPQPGMLLAAAQRLNIDLARSLFIGDRISDMQAAGAAGLRTAFLVETGYGAGEAVRIAEEAIEGLTVHVVPSVAAAAERIPTLAVAVR